MMHTCARGHGTHVFSYGLERVIKNDDVDRNSSVYVYVCMRLRVVSETVRARERNKEKR